MTSPKSFAVLGRGIAGLMAAYHLERAGYKPSVFGRLEDRASAAAQGILCNKGLIFYGSPLFKAKLESLQSMKDFLDELERVSGHTIPRTFSGVFEPYWDEEDFQKTIVRIYRHKFWGFYQTENRAPLLTLPERTRNPAGELFYPRDGWFDPLAVLKALEAYLRDRGIDFIEEKVAAFRTDDSEGLILQTKESSKSYAFDRAVLASGAGSKELWEAAGLKDQRMFFIGGQTLSIPRQGNEPPRVMVKGNRSLTVLADQAILGSSSWKDFESDDLKADAQQIQADAEESFGMKFDGEYEARVGVRMRFKDRMPLVGWVSTGLMAQKLYILTGFYKNGMHLAETCAKEMILDVAEEGYKRRFPEFSPLRFSV